MTTARIRKISAGIAGQPTTDGAGVNLTRFIGSPELSDLDPFLLLDEFRSTDSGDYQAGFPDHPHRGFETVTYLKAGRFRHRDSQGNQGLLTPGGVQWMTAGRGIIHSEMPETTEGLVWGYQLWINLPAEHKFTDPRYQDIPPEQVPEVTGHGVKVRLITGDYGGQSGPAKTWISTLYFDIELEPGAVFTHSVPPNLSGFVHLYTGSLTAGPETESQEAQASQLLVLGEGDAVRLQGGPEGAGCLLVAGERLDEPIARAGPFVLNTREQLEQAFRDYQAGVLDS